MLWGETEMAPAVQVKAVRHGFQLSYVDPPSFAPRIISVTPSLGTLPIRVKVEIASAFGSSVKSLDESLD